MASHSQLSSYSLPVFLVWLSFTTDNILMTMQIPLFPTLELSPILTGCLFSSKALFQILSTPIATRIIDRYSKPKLILLGLIIEIGCIMLFFYDRSFEVWLIARSVSGVAAQFII